MNRHTRRKLGKNAFDKLTWVCNDVAKPTANAIVVNPGEDPRQALRDHMKWRSQFTIGDPAPTKELSIRELKKAGVVGLYTDDVRKFI